MRPRYKTRRQQLGDNNDNNSDADSAADSAADLLPVELLQMLASKLNLEDLAAASMTCRHWANVLRAGLTHATLVLGGGSGDDSEPAAAVKSLAQHSTVSDLEVLLNSRSDYSSVEGALGSLGSMSALKNLQLSFLVSCTPRKGSYPVFFADKLDVSGVQSLSIDSPAMPEAAVKNLINKLSLSGGGTALQHLSLRLNLQPPNSQLPPSRSPIWLLDSCPALCCGLQGSHIKQLASSLTSLRSLHFDVDWMLTPAEQFQSLSLLTGLTELLFHQNLLPAGLLKKLPLLRSLKRLHLSCQLDNLNAALPDMDLSFVQDLNLGLACNKRSMGLAARLSRAFPSLQGLTYTSVNMHDCELGHLTGLTSLNLLQVDAFTTSPYWDLTPLSQVTCLQQLTIQVDATFMLKYLDFKFSGPPPPSKPARVLTGPCQSVGKRRKSAAQQQWEQNHHQQQQQQESEVWTRWGDISAMLGAWPHLKDLNLSGILAVAVSETSWAGLSACSSLTRLVLKFLPVHSDWEDRVERSLGLKRPATAVGGGMPVLRLEHLPAGLRELQLSGCYVGVPAQGCLNAGVSLETVSLAKCVLDGIQKGASTRKGDPIIVVNGYQPWCSTSSSSSASTQQQQQQYPLQLLLQHTPKLRTLELIDLPWLSDAVLGAAAAEPNMRGLRSLSVVGVAQQQPTNGGLLGLTRLRKLRELRWHVGDSLEPMPDLQALVQLKGLMRLHIPIWLHNKMERWGGYAALDSMPLCDVNVDLVT